MIEDGPMKEHMKRSKEGVIKSQYKNSAKGDYVDSITSEPIVEVK